MISRRFVFVAFAFVIHSTQSTTVKDILNTEGLFRTVRDTKYPTRYGGGDDKNVKPDEYPDKDNLSNTAVDKRCIRCGYDDRYPYERRGYYDDRTRNYDRYDDDRYYDNDRYYGRDRYDRYGDRNADRYGDRNADRYSGRARYGLRDRYDQYDRSGDRYYDRYNDYDRYERTDPYDRNDRYTDRGVGYDNRGYDYRASDRDGYRPWDETYRGTSGFDSAGRGYYFAAGRPEYGSTGGYSGRSRDGYGGERYASGYYGHSGSGNDDYYRDRGYGGSGGYRPPSNNDGYRTTSYLYGRQSSTTDKPSIDVNSANTPSPETNSG